MAVDWRERLGGPTALAFGGLACARAWLSLAYVAPETPVLSHTWFDVGYIGLGIAVVLFARRIEGLSRWRWPYLVALCTMLVAAVCAGFGSAWGLAGVLLDLVALASGVGFGLACLLNAESLVRLGLVKIVLYLAANHVVASVLVFVLTGLEPLQATAALVLLAMGSVGLVRLSFDVPATLGVGHVGIPLRSYPWQLYGLVALCAFAYGMRQATMVAGAGRHSGLSTALLMGAIFVWALVTTRQFSMVRAARLSLPLMAVGLILVLLPTPWGGTLSSYCVALSFSLISFCASVLLYAMSRSTGVPIAPLLGGLSATQAATVAGDLSARWLPSASWGILAVVAGCVVLLSLGLLFLGRDYSSRWSRGVLLETSLAAEENPAEQLGLRCRRVADAFGLTERETCVLETLVGPKTNRAIAVELGITPGTLKTHIRHIYEKTGVHSREGLGELVGVAPREDGVTG